jgi:hypothetical protein
MGLGADPQTEQGFHAPHRYSWHQKLSRVLFSIFCFELGVFLIVFPWLENWPANYFSWVSPESSMGAWIAGNWRGFWTSPYLRGAISGLGFVNVYISILEVVRLRRFASQSVDEE